MLHKLWTSFSFNWWTTTLVLVMALIISGVSGLGICTDHCSANVHYFLFGFPFAFFGVLFFTLLIILHLLSVYFHQFNLIFNFSIFCAVGAELWFLVLQKYQIGSWCPLCVAIASCVVLVTGLRIVKIVYFREKGGNMERRLDYSLACVVIGFVIAFFGVTQSHPVYAGIAEMKEQLAFGNTKSPVEVYFLTDWFCPSCTRAEKVIESVCPKIEKRVSFYFIDLPIHRNSLNFTPYHLAFAVHNKEDYFTARQVLADLTKKTETPRDDDVNRAAKKYDIKFEELPYVDVKNGMDYFDRIVSHYKINATPTVIVTNRISRFTEILEGSSEINEENILRVIDRVEKGK